MILDEIVAARREDVREAKQRVSAAELRNAELYELERRPFAACLRAAVPAIIAEVKKASPSRGVIRADIDPVALGRSYAAAGAAAISVLTEERYFQGRPEYLSAIRSQVDVPVLRKDFLFDSYQVAEARAWGADAVLLIVAVLDGGALDEMLAATRETGLEALVEAHTEQEVERAVAAGAEIIGINNRNLRTFVTTLETAERLRPHVPAGCVAVAESGIDSARDIARLQKAGFNAFLIGESLMKAPDPGARLRFLLEAARG